MAGLKPSWDAGPPKWKLQAHTPFWSSCQGVGPIAGCPGTQKLPTRCIELGLRVGHIGDIPLGFTILVGITMLHSWVAKRREMRSDWTECE